MKIAKEGHQRLQKVEEMKLGVKVTRPLEKCPFGVERYPEIFYECLRDMRKEDELNEQRISESLRHQFKQKLVMIQENEKRMEEERMRIEEVERLQKEKEDIDGEDGEIKEDAERFDEEIGDSGEQDGQFLNKRNPKDIDKKKFTDDEIYSGDVDYSNGRSIN